MKKTYQIKVIQRAWMKIEADGELSQDEIYELAKKKASEGKLKFEEPSFNIISISIDDVDDEDIKPKVLNLEPKDPLTVTEEVKPTKKQTKKK